MMLCTVTEAGVTRDAELDRATAVDWCRLQWPRDEQAGPGEAFDVYGRLWQRFLTERTKPAVDPLPLLIGAAGYGPDGSDPATDPGWHWSVPAAPNDSRDANDEPNNDEYLASLTAPVVPGTYDLAFRFSLDGGAAGRTATRTGTPTRWRRRAASRWPTRACPTRAPARPPARRTCAAA